VLFIQCVLQDLQKQKEAKEEELLGLQKDVNDKKSKVDTLALMLLLFISQHTTYTAISTV